LSFFYLLLGLVCTTVNELIAGWWNTRAKYLDEGINRLLGGDAALKKELYKHPLILSLARSDKVDCPSYIPAGKFATALLDILSGAGKPLTDVAAVQAGADTKSAALKGSIGALIARSNGDPDKLHFNVAAWFDDGMDRVSGWYKRNAQYNSLILAAIVTLAINADTLHVADVLWTSPTTRAAVVQAAQTRASQARPEAALPMVEYPNPHDATASKPQNVPTNPEDALTAGERQLLGVLTGWDPEWKKLGAAADPSAWIAAFLAIIWNHLLGWVLTAIAVSLGAPFWFDTLNRFINIRNAGRAPDEARAKNAPPAVPPQP
jgi:hypothetical protein